jgi:multidrug efflux pump subunit AcrA (membrane-fusion protein)
LAWQTSGRVGTVNVKIGDKVSVDTVLAALEQSSLPREILLAGADLVAAQQALAKVN